LIIIVVEIVILFPIVQKVGFFELFGAVNIFICYAATFAGSPRLSSMLLNACAANHARNYR
jgi:hypothetical protein